MSARALASASRPPRALIFPLSFELSERPKISICCRDDDRARPHTRAPDRDMRARARRARNLSRIACAVTVAVLARTATASAWEFTGRDVDRPAKRVDGERSWSAPVMAEALRARARYVTPPVGVAALLRARPTLRAKLVSYCAVALACAWFVARRALSQTRNALTPRKVRAQRREFQARMMGYRSASARSRSVRGAGEAESSATARAKLENAMRAKREAEGYMVELHALQREFEVSALHKDMIVDSGNPELDVREAYERGLVAGGTKASVAAGDMRRRAGWHATHDLEEAMKSWEAVSAESREHMYEGYQGGWYTANTPLGVPVYVERLGTLDVEKMLKTASVEDIVEQRMRMQGYMIKTLLPEMARRPGSIARDKIVHVIDMKGAGLSLLSSRNIAVFKRLQEVDANFPEFLYRTYVVNVPIGARVVWSTFSAILPSRVRAKVRILGSVKGGNLTKLAAIMGGVDRVPEFLGGNCKRKLNECPPWSLQHMNDTTFVPWEKNVSLTKLAVSTPLSPNSFSRAHASPRGADDDAISYKTPRSASMATPTSVKKSNSAVKRLFSLKSPGKSA